MTTSYTVPTTRREPDLAGQTVVVIGGSAGIGLETARLARAEGPTSSSPLAIPTASSDAARRARRAQHRSLRRHRSRSARTVLRGAALADRPRDGHRQRPVLLAAGRHRLRPRRAARSTSTCG